MIAPIQIPTSMATSPLGGAKAGAQPDKGFAALLGDFLSQGVETIRQGEQAAIDGITGKEPLQSVVDKVTSAEQALQAGLALRDKLVAAYLEVSRMPI